MRERHIRVIRASSKVPLFLVIVSSHFLSISLFFFLCMCMCICSHMCGCEYTYMSFNVKARQQPLLSSVGTYLFQKIFIYLYLGAKECMCHDIHRGRVREQLVAVGTFLLPYGSWGIRLSFQTLWQVPLPIESSCCHPKLVS